MTLWLSLILVGLMILVGGERGASSVFALITNAMVYLICVYAISLGVNVYFVTLVCSIIFTSITLFAQNGVNIKTKAATESVLIVMLMLVIICGYIVRETSLGGFSEIDIYQEETTFLNNKIGIDANDIMTGVVFLSLLGAIMDTALAITTSVYEVYQNNKELSVKELIHSGGNIGKDILGTTTNTLLFVGFGEAMFLFILLGKNHYTLVELLNSKAFFQELFIIVISNIGCLSIIPLTSIIIAYKLKKQRA